MNVKLNKLKKNLEKSFKKKLKGSTGKSKNREKRSRSSTRKEKKFQSKRKEDFTIPSTKKKKEIDNAIKLIHDHYLPALKGLEGMPSEKILNAIRANPRLYKLLEPFLRLLGVM